MSKLKACVHTDRRSVTRVTTRDCTTSAICFSLVSTISTAGALSGVRTGFTPAVVLHSTGNTGSQRWVVGTDVTSATLLLIQSSLE